MDFIIALRERKTMAKNRQRPPQAKMATNNPPGNHSDEEVQDYQRYLKKSENFVQKLLEILQH